MAELSTHHVVDQSQSVGDLSPSDAPAITSNTTSAFTGEVDSSAELAQTENGIHNSNLVKIEDLDDVSARSDTDTSRADGSVSEDKPVESKPVKKFSTSKPLSFAKYSVPKVVAANAAIKGVEKVPTPSSSTSSLQQIGRPRLVAKNTISLQQKAKAYKPVAPDPMQVWNKNRATPQPSTKHLTDEELKQQYGIHLTSRLQADAEGKEAKWADIDDDEDDWAPETIEWNDGTTTTLAATDVTLLANQKQKSDIATTESPPQPDLLKARPPQFVSSVGPNATVLKLGASAERQQAQKAAAEKARSPLEKPLLSLASGALAPAPAKSPWASLPPVDKVSPVAINPQPMAPPPRYINQHGYSQSPPTITAPSPATEISADDFNRAWKDSPSTQTRELYMPNSGRYEAVPEGGRRRMSKNDQSFRAPAVLQRPSQSDIHAPAEPSAAFQTNRTSTDVGRRRASSTISGSSGQFARRMSIKSSEVAPAVFDSQPRPSSQDGPSDPGQTPISQARPSTGESAPGPVPALYDIEAQREKQKAEMKQRIELARRRKEEEQAREEAEKQERIRQKLASLAPLPEPEATKFEPESAEIGELEIPLPNNEHEVVKRIPETPSDNRPAVSTALPSSPPKPPPPLATGAPQQYGMMKVHPMDTVAKMGGVISQAPGPSKAREQNDDIPRSMQPPTANMRPSNENRRQRAPESLAASDASPKLSKPVSAGPEHRNGWGDMVDHRAPPTGNLWGIPNNKALGNGTFDQSLAGYAPQDLSRTSSTGHGWMSGRTPTAGRSPQPQYLNHHVPDNRPQPQQSLISPEAIPLAIDSEADSLFPVIRPAPIGPPQVPVPQPPINGTGGPPQMNGIAAWNNFHQVAGQQERAETERFQRDLAARREEELRTGVRQGPQYTFNETWKHVQIGEQAGQRQVSNVVQSSAGPSSTFGAVGQPTRGSRFFPPSAGLSHPDRRAVSYSHPEVPRSPSPPPAEEYESYHPAYDGDKEHPAVRMPKARPVVNLPPALPPTPPTPVEPVATSQVDMQPLTWAARVSMPSPAPAVSPSIRAVSTPIAQPASWQEKFNGLLGKKAAPSKTSPELATDSLAVASSTREPLDVIAPELSASVSLPRQVEVDLIQDAGLVTSKDVEDEEDLFEDRELASLPAISLPLQSFVQLPLHEGGKKFPLPVDSSSIQTFMVAYHDGRPPNNPPQFTFVRMHNGMKAIRLDLPSKTGAAPTNGSQKQRTPTYHAKKNYRGSKPRQPSKVD